LSVSQNDALYSLLGTLYGGDGVNTFGIPDLRGRIPIHLSSNYPQGALAGTEQVTLNLSQLPAHSHGAAKASTPLGTNVDSPTNNYWGGDPNLTEAHYAAAPNSIMNPQ